MQTFKLQVEDQIGRTVSDTDGLNDMLTATAREVADFLPKDILIRNATLTEFTSNPYSVVNMRILAVSRNGHYANEMPHGMATRVADSGSIYFADSTQNRDPVFYFKGSDLYVLPAPTASLKGEILKYSYPTVAHGDTGVSSFPDSAEYAITLGAASKFLSKLAAEDHAAEDVELSASTSGLSQQVEADYQRELGRIREQK
jgi:hypothetical protein